MLFRVPSPESRVPHAESRVPPTQQGFTLIEVLAALALLAITFAVLLQAMGASLHLTANADARTQATLWAQSKLDSSFVLTPPHSSVTEGTFDTRFRWRLTVQPWQPPVATMPASQTAGTPQGASGLHLYQLDLAVSWGQGQHTRTVHYVTLRASSFDDTANGLPP